MKKLVAIALAVAASLCLIATVVSTATRGWIVISYLSTSLGLFQECVLSDCWTITSPSPAYEAVRAFMIIAIILNCANVILCGLVAVNKGKPILIPIFFLCTGISIMIAMSVFTSEIGQTLEDLQSDIYGYSYILGWISVVANIVLAVVSGGLARVSEYSVIS